jgi:hypothetical protein
LSVEVAEYLQRAGYDAVTFKDVRLSGYQTRLLQRWDKRERRVLLTLDIDFADIRAYPPADYVGLVVMCLRWQDKLHVLETIARLIVLLS